MADHKDDVLEFYSAESTMQNIFDRIDAGQVNVDGLCLINNAATVGPLGVVETFGSTQVDRHFSVNLLAPIVLTACFIKLSDRFNVDKRIINISLASALYPAAEMSCYCASKAALEMFTQCVDLEQSANPWPIQLITMNPGMVDTNMQREARVSEGFGLAAFFRHAQAEGRLRRADDVAKKIVELITAADVPLGKIIDIET